MDWAAEVAFEPIGRYPRLYILNLVKVVGLAGEPNNEISAPAARSLSAKNPEYERMQATFGRDITDFYATNCPALPAALITDGLKSTLLAQLTQH